MSHTIRERSVVNNSVSKQQFAFSKASRFPTDKKPTKAFGYEISGYFGKGNKASGVAFGVREDRFGYEEIKKEQRGRGNINSPDSVQPLSTKIRTASFSFGVSRSAMKKIHVDEILKRKDENVPGPDRYGKKDTFGKTAGSTMYSFGAKLNHFDKELGRERKKPGPGAYHAGDLMGSGLNTSTMRSATKSSFPKSQDRFRPPKQQSPPATTY